MSAPQILDLLLPYLVTALLALVPALVEVLRTFGQRVGFVLRSGAGWAILGLNAVTGALTFALVQWLLGVRREIPTAFVVGLTFPTLLRNPLTFVKSVQTSEAEFEESALHVIADLYNQLLRQAREDADTMQADERTRLAVKLAKEHGAEALAQQVQWRIDALLDDKSRTRYRKALDQALTYKEPLDRGVAVGLVALDVVPRSTIRQWLRREGPLASPAP